MWDGCMQDCSWENFCNCCVLYVVQLIYIVYFVSRTPSARHWNTRVIRRSSCQLLLSNGLISSSVRLAVTPSFIRAWCTYALLTCLSACVKNSNDGFVSFLPHDDFYGNSGNSIPELIKKNPTAWILTSSRWLIIYINVPRRKSPASS